MPTPNAEDTRFAAPPEPSEANGYLAAHVRMLRDSLRRWTGRELIPAEIPEHEAGRWLFEAPFVGCRPERAVFPPQGGLKPHSSFSYLRRLLKNRRHDCSGALRPEQVVNSGCKPPLIFRGFLA